MQPTESRIDNDQYGPFLVDGRQVGEKHAIDAPDAPNAKLNASVWRAGPVSFPYIYAHDEAVHILEGEVSIDIVGGNSITLRPGDIAVFARGTQSVWRIDDFVKKFSVISWAEND